MTAIVWPLTASAAAVLTFNQVRDMTTAQAASLTAAALGAMPPSVFAAFGVAEIKALSPSAFAGVTSAQLSALSPAQTQALSAAQLNALSKAAMGGVRTDSLTADQARGLSTAALAAMTTAEVAALSTAALRALSPTQVAAFAAADFATLTSAQVAALSTADVGALSATQVASLLLGRGGFVSAAQIGALSTSALAGLSAPALAALSPAQVGALSASQFNALSANQIQALRLSALATSTLKALSAATIGAMTAAEFSAAVGANIGQLATAQIKAITAAEISGLSSAQIAALTPAQVAALSTAAGAAYAAMQASNSPGASVLSDFQSQVSNGSIGYAGLLKVLQDAAAGGVNSGEFSALTAIANKLNASGGVTTSAYVQQIFDDVVLGNSANKYWTGGAAAPVALGNLSGASSETQADRLIGKWFLGTDLPSYQSVTSYGGGYQSFSLPLFGASGAPQVSDINQGQVGDCFFLSSLATEAEQNPSLIKNMIQSNGNGTYSVMFHVNGQNDFVTVDSELVTFKNNQISYDGSSMLFDSNTASLWAPLIEKGYAELMAQTGVQTYARAGNVDSYAAINGGDSNGLTALTGQSVSELALGGTTSASALQTDFSSVASAFASHQGVLFGTDSTSKGDFVGGHMYSVTGVDAGAGTLQLHNPWGDAACSAFGMHSTFSVTMAQLKAEGGVLEFTTGAVPTV